MASVIEIFESIIFWFIIAILFAVIGAALFNTYRRNCGDLKEGRKKYSIAVISDTIAGLGHKNGNDGVVLTRSSSNSNSRNSIYSAPVLPSSLVDSPPGKMGSAKSLISIYIPSRNASVASIDEASQSMPPTPVSV